jgi:hypothetical protein
MKIPKIFSAQAIDDLTLVVEFSNGDRKQYNISQLLGKPMFSRLKNPGFFRSFQVETGGYGIVWNDEIDLSEYELWRNVVEGDCASVVG